MKWKKWKTKSEKKENERRKYIMLNYDRKSFSLIFKYIVKTWPHRIILISSFHYVDREIADTQKANTYWQSKIVNLGSHAVPRKKE